MYKKIIISLCLLSLSVEAQTPVSRSTLTTAPYSWASRLVPTINFLNNTWASFYNVVDNPPTGTGSVVTSGGVASLTGTLSIRQGTDDVRFSMQPLVGATTLPALYMAQATPASTNYAIASNPSLNVFNSPGTIQLRSKDVTLYQGNSLPTNVSGGSHQFLSQSNSGLPASPVLGLVVSGNMLGFTGGTTMTLPQVERNFSSATYSAASSMTMPSIGAMFNSNVAGPNVSFSTNQAIVVAGNASVTANLVVNGTSTVTGGIGMGAAPSTNNIINSLATVSGRHGFFITNLSSGVSAQSAIRLGNNSNQATIGQAGSGATTANGLYALGLNFQQDDPGGFIFNQLGSATSGAYTRLRITGGAYTNQTASAEIPGFIVSGVTRQWATGAIPLQREVCVYSSTYSAVGASTLAAPYGLFVEKATSGTNMTFSENDGIGTDGNVVMTSVGSGLAIKEGTNARLGTSTLVSGTVTISNTSVTNNTRFFPTAVGSPTLGTISVLSYTVGTGFTVSSGNALDNRRVDWQLIEGK